jgi:hypothetical protein
VLSSRSATGSFAIFLPPSGSWDRRGLVRSEKLGTSPRRVPRPVQERGRLRHGHRIGLADLPQYLIHATLLPIRPRRTYATTVSQSPPECLEHRRTGALVPSGSSSTVSGASGGSCSASKDVFIMLQSSPTTAASHNPCYQREVIPQNPTLPGLWLTLVVERNRNRAGTFRSSYGLNFVKSQLGEVRRTPLPRTSVNSPPYTQRRM